MVAIKQTGINIIKIGAGIESPEIVEKLTKIHNENFEEKKNESYFLEILNNDLYDVYCLSEEKTSEISGYAVFYDTFDSTDLFEIAVLKKKQGKGYGNALLKYTADIFCKSGRKIFLEVNENNEKAIKLYKKNGFEEISVRKNYYGNNQNAVIMMKNEDI